MKVYKFSLFDEYSECLIMSTEVDEPDPKADIELWERFMQGGSYIVYLGEREEDDDDSQ